MGAITVGQLRDILTNNPDLTDDMIVVLSGDSEGNTYSPMSERNGWSFGRYDAYSPSRGEYYDASSYTEEMVASGEPDRSREGVPAFALWPIS